MTNNTIEKAQGGFDSKGLDTNTINDLDFPTGERKNKAISAIRAQLALHDHELTVMQCRDFLVHTSTKTRYLPDLTALQAFAQNLGVSK